jgi:hypothetical protein
MRQLAVIFFLFIGGISLIIDSGCANVIPPQGGPKDSIPPKLIRISPPDSTLEFSGDKITFTFDEYVEIQNIQENLVVSPIPRFTPAVAYRLNTVTLRLNDPLEPNTTYSFNFGKAIKDVNEGNPLDGFTYTFSTGSYLDSLELRGKVILAETGKIDTTLIVMLHISADDSAVVTEKPRYLTKLDRQGGFVFKNLPAKTFYVYALKDEGGSFRYFNERQLFAFADAPVTTGNDSLQVTLYAYSGKPTTTQPQISAPTRIGKKTGESPADKRLRYQTSLTGNQQDLLSEFFISFEQPLKIFDSSKIILTTDTVFTPVAGYRFVTDSVRKKIRLVFDMKENTQYNIILDKEFAIDTLGRKLLKTDTIRFTTKKLNEYGSLKLRLRNLDLSGNPVLQVLKNETVYKSYVLAGNEISETIFLPGDYELRILYDKNKNGIWDPGEFFGKHKQPELVKPIERRIIVKANSPNEFEVSL